MPTREDAWKLLCEYTRSESLRKHMLAVEACVRAYARKHGADEELWGVAALLHDFDYERWPNEAHAPDKEHPAEGAKILREQGYSEEIVRAILSHADYCNVPRQSPLEHVLFACDELAGEEDVLKRGLTGHVAVVCVGEDGADDFLGVALLAKNLGAFGGVLLVRGMSFVGPALVVEIVEQSGDAPEFLVRAV